MRLADVTEIDKEGKLAIPDELGNLIGFEHGSKVFFRFIKSTYTTSDNKDGTEYQLKISPIDPDMWNKLYDIEFTLGDTPGSFSAFANILRSHKIRFLFAETRTYLHNVKAECTATVHFGKFLGDVNDLDRKIAEEVERDFKLRICIKPIRMDFMGETWVIGKPSPLQYYSSKREYAPGIAGKIGKDEPISLEPAEKRLIIEHNRIRMPGSVITRLNRHFQLPNKKSGIMTVQGSCRCLAVVDTEIKMLSINFLDPGARIAKIEFHLADDPDAILAVSDFLKTKNTNLLETRIMTLATGEHAVWRVIADFSRSPFHSENADELSKRIEKEMSDIRFLKNSDSIKVLKIFGQTGESFHAEAFEILREIENSLRQIIKEKMNEQYGKKQWWKNAVPEILQNKVLERLQNKKLIPPDQDSLGDFCIDFLDLGDYCSIIANKDNCKFIFKEAKQALKDSIVQKLQELISIRNSVMHFRSISESDFMRIKVYREDILAMLENRKDT